MTAPDPATTAVPSPVTQWSPPPSQCDADRADYHDGFPFYLP